MRLDFAINPRKVGFLLGGIAIVLAVLSLAGEYLLSYEIVAEGSNPARVIDLFSVNLEDSIPTWYSTINLLAAAVLFGFIATAKRMQKDRWSRYWTGLALIFLYMSVDEGAAIHEMFSDMIEPLIPPTGIFTFGWVVVGAPVALIVGLLYLRFVLNLPPRTRNLFFLSGALYIGGALVVEAISASTYVDDGINFRYLAIATIEETCEMLGVITLIYTLLAYLGVIQLEIALHPPASTSAELVEAPPSSPPGARMKQAWTLHRQTLISIAAGVAVAAILWILLNEFSLLGWNAEIPLLLVIVTCVCVFVLRQFGRLPDLTPETAFIIALTLPLWFRMLVFVFDRLGLAAPFFALLLVMAAAVVSLTKFHLLGLIMSAVLLLLNPPYMVVYLLFVIIALAVIAADSPSRGLAFAAAGAVLWMFFFPGIDQQTRTLLLAQLGDLPAGTTTVYSDENLDVLRTPDNATYLYVNGEKAAGSYPSPEFVINLINEMTDSQNALVIGTGAMETANAIDSAHLTTLETDATTAGVRLLYLDALNDTVVVDEISHYFSTNTQRYDLIFIETPSLLDIQTVKLYSVPTYTALESRLTAEGIVVTSLISPFKPDERISRQIAASLLATFDEVMVIAPASIEWSFAFAADDLPFDRQTLSDLLTESGAYVLFDTPAVKAVVGDAEPVN